MGESITTRLDVPYAQQPETRAAARRVLDRLGAADLLDILGLDDSTATDSGSGICSTCGRPRERDGRPCRRVTCVGPAGREATR